MTKQELINNITDADLLIKKVPGNDEFHMDIVAKGTAEAIACIIGKTLVDLANSSNAAQHTIVTVCRAIVDQYEEQMEEGQNEENRL